MSANPNPADTSPKVPLAEGVKLHIGGTERRDGWVILDALPGPVVDHVGNCNDLSFLADESCSEVYASHVLGHLGYNGEIQKTLKGIHRVLKPGGRFCASVPDLATLSWLFLHPSLDAAGRFQVMRMMFGGRTTDYDVHYTGLNFEFLGGLLHQAGFREIRRVQDFDLFKDTSTLRFANVPVSLNVEAWKEMRTDTDKLTGLPSVIPGQINTGYIRTLLNTNAPVILDIGANDGSTTLSFLKEFPDAKIYAFEPDPRAAAKFRTLIKGDDRVRLFEIAIGARDREAEFHCSSGVPPGATLAQYPQGWDQSGSLRAPKTTTQVWPWCKFESKITVTVRQLDSWAKEHLSNGIDFIWADVQGAEGDLIAGGTETLAKTRYFYTEYSNDEWYEGQPNLLQLSRKLNNFVIVHRFAMDVLFRNKALT
jgi:FkbM family methyltransferase